MPPDEGAVFLMGKDIAHLAEDKRRPILKQIEMQFQQGALFDSMTVRGNILVPLNEETGLKPGEKEEIRQKMEHYRQDRATKGHFQYPCAGC